MTRARDDNPRTDRPAGVKRDPAPRRDWSSRTPPFRLTDVDLERLATVIAIALHYRCDPIVSVEQELEIMHRVHCFWNRPLLGLCNSLAVPGHLAFERDWLAHRDTHMAEAFAAYRQRKTELEENE